MKYDSTVYCVSGHSDNGFYTTTKNEQMMMMKNEKILNGNEFDFRRGQHFMA
jgi:hypothetical protein